MVQLMLLPPNRLLLYLNPDWFHLSGACFIRVVLGKRLLNGCLSLQRLTADKVVYMDKVR